MPAKDTKTSGVHVSPSYSREEGRKAVQIPEFKADRDSWMGREGQRDTEAKALGRLRQGSLSPGVTDHQERHSRVAILIQK